MTDRRCIDCQGPTEGWARCTPCDDRFRDRVASHFPERSGS